MTDAQRRLRRSLWVRILGCGAALGAAALLCVLVLNLWIAHRPSPVRTAVTAAQIQAEDARLQRMGLILRDGSFLKRHPFESPWTSHSLLMPSSWAEPNFKHLLAPPHTVRADLLLTDLDVLQPVMIRAYGGWDSAAARGWNWGEWFRGWRVRLVARGNAELSLDEAFAPMDQLFAFQRDNHTQIPLDRQATSDGSQTALLASTPAASCTEVRASLGIFPIAANDAGQQVRTAKLWKSGATSFSEASYISMPSSRGVPQAVLCGTGWIALQPVEKQRRGGLIWMLRQLWAKTAEHDRPSIERIGNGVVVARLPTFNSSNYEGISRVGWIQREASDRVLIIDLRGNGGGDAGYGFDALKEWVDQSRMVRFDSIGAQIVSSCLYPALRWGYPDTVGKEQMQKMLDRIAQPYPPGCPRSVAIRPSKWTYLQHRFAPKPGDMLIIVLVNSHCGSDCELMTEELASLPETIVAGVNTYGVCQMIQPGYSVLPHTALRYRMSLGRSDPYGDNRSVDGYGLDVDVLIPGVDRLGDASLKRLAEMVARY